MENNKICDADYSLSDIIMHMMNAHSLFTAQLYEVALKLNLENTQEFINWQDCLNEFSLLPNKRIN